MNKILYGFRIYCLLVIFLFSSGNLTSRPDNIADIKFRNLTTKEGLSSNSIQSCLMDSYGFMWIGTQAGLNRYDGKTIKVYDHSDSD
ncbi:MAG: hypothetical protein L0Y76_11405, partial [Ignavibacteria bacterium]|nr:hypothetical protein [Ignavibacteria bacterium]